jgi:S1-C subfamily serine protease
MARYLWWEAPPALILSVDGAPTPTVGALSAVLAELKPGERARVVVRDQNGAKTTLRVSLGTYPGG